MIEYQQISLRVVQTDKETNEKSEIYSGSALKSIDNTLIVLHYRETVIPFAEVSLQIDGENVRISRVFESGTELNFKVGQQTNASVSTPYGVLAMDVQTDVLTRSNAHIHIDYRLLNRDEYIGGFISDWYIEENKQ